MQNRNEVTSQEQDVVRTASNYATAVAAAKFGVFAASRCLCPTRTAIIAGINAASTTYAINSDEPHTRPITESVLNAASAMMMAVYGYQRAARGPQLYDRGYYTNAYVRKMSLLGFLPAAITAGISFFTFNQVRHLETPVPASNTTPPRL